MMSLEHDAHVIKKKIVCKILFDLELQFALGLTEHSFAVPTN
jgi:hypothetical protein